MDSSGPYGLLYIVAKSVENQWSAKMIAIDLLSCSQGLLACKYIHTTYKHYNIVPDIKVFTGHMDQGYNFWLDSYYLFQTILWLSNFMLNKEKKCPKLCKFLDSKFHLEIHLFQGFFLITNSNQKVAQMNSTNQ